MRWTRSPGNSCGNTTRRRRKQKVLAARRAGIKTIILPRRNERDLEDIQPEVRKELEMIFVDTVDEVIRAWEQDR